MSDDTITVTVLSDNTVGKPGILAEHGLSLSIKHHGKHLLFDTGASDLLLRNAQKLGLSLQNLDAIVLSHGHYDHTGGLTAVRRVSDAPVYAHPSIAAERFSHRNGQVRSIGFPGGKAFEMILDGMHLSDKPERIEGFHQSGQIPRTNLFEKPPPHLFMDREGTVADTILDDQGLFINTCKGLVIFLGCCHAGLVNTLSHIRKISGENHIHWIVGGTHLRNASERLLEHTLKALHDFTIDRISLLHCSGLKGKHFFLTHFSSQYTPLCCGDEIVI